MSKYKGVTTLIFDLGGVLVNLDWKSCVNNFKKIGVSEMETLLSTTLQRGFILEYERGEISTEQFRAEVRKYTEVDVTDGEIDFAWSSLLVDLPEEKLQLLLELKKKSRILMLSNTNELSFSHCEEHYFNKNGHQTSDYFDKCYLSFEIGHAKPDREIFDFILADSGMVPSETLFLDDGKANIEIGKEIGFETCLVDQTEDLRKVFTDRDLL